MILLFLLAQTLVPIFSDQRAPTPAGYPESWSKVAVHSTGQVARVWTGPGPDVVLQVGSHFAVVNQATSGIQDEPEIEALPAECLPKAFAVAYNQRVPYMHVEACLFDINGSRIGNCFQVDQQPTAWRPLMTVRDDGQIAFMYTGGFDNNGYVRFYDAQSATWASESSLLFNNPNGDQEDPTGTYLADGSLFTVWTDFHHGGLGLELMCGVSIPDNQGCDPATISTLVPFGLSGDQRWPRAAWDGVSCSPWVVWEDPAGVWLWKGSEASLTFIGPGHLPDVAPPFVVYQQGGDIKVWPGTGQNINRFTTGLQERPTIRPAPNNGFYVAWQGRSFFNALDKDVFLRGFQTQ
jgi:hypothetical protein